MRLLRLSSVLLPAMLLSALAVPAAAQSIQTLVIRDDPVPGVGLITRIDTLAINNSGDWLVEADTDHPDTSADSVLLFNGALFLREGQALSAPAGATLRTFDDLWLNNLGNQSHNLFLNGTSGTFDDSAVYWNDVMVLQESTISAAAGFSPGTPYIGFFGTKINDSNQILVMASVDDPNIASSVDRALVIFDVDLAGNLVSETVFAKEADVLPGQTEAVTDFRTGPHEWAFDNSGQIMFVALLTGATATNNAIYIGNTLIAQKGSPSPVAGFDYSGFTGTKLDLSSNGLHYAFSTAVSGATATNAMIVRDGAKLIQKGDSLPAISPFVFTTFGTGPVQVSDSGDVLWYGDWDDPDTTRDKGLFINHDLVVQIGVTTIGGETVTTLRGIQDGYALSRNGRYVIFEAILSSGREGAFLLDRFGSTTDFCAGDSGCPCSNDNDGSLGVAGCANSSFASGCRITTGGTHPTATTVVAQNAKPGQFGIVVRGTGAGSGVTALDGWYCLQGNTARTGTFPIDAFGAAESPALPQGPAGVTWYYQFWYRDNDLCAGSNFSNGIEITW